MCSSPELHLAIYLFTYLLEEGYTDAMAQDIGTGKQCAGVSSLPNVWILGISGQDW